MTLGDLIERTRAQRALRNQQGSFDRDVEPAAQWWPFIKLSITWAEAFPDWTMPAQEVPFDEP